MSDNAWFSTVVRSSECGSAFRFGEPDSRAVLIQIKAPEMRVSPQELDTDLNFSGRDFARPYNQASSASVLALDNECAARLHPLAQCADLGPGRADVQSVYEEVGNGRSLLGNPESNDHLCPFNVAFIQRSRTRFV